MKPQYVRFVVSCNKDFQYNTPSQSANHSKTILSVIHRQNTLSSLKVLNGIPSTASTISTHIILTPSPSTFNLSNDLKTQKTNNSTPVNLSSSSIDIPVTKSSTIQVIPKADICKCICFKNSFVTYSQKYYNFL